MHSENHTLPDVSVTVTKEPEFLGSETGGGCYPTYRLRVTVGDRSAEVDGWLMCGWLRPGAHRDLDGSGLAVWGDGQPGGWGCYRSDGQEDGTPRVELSNDGSEVLVRGPSTDPEPVLRVAVPAGVDAADLANAIDDAIERAVPDLEEPSADEVWDSLDIYAEVGPDETVRLGDAEGAGLCLAWELPDGSHEFAWWPDEDDIARAVREAVVPAARREILRELEEKEEAEA